MPDEFYNAGKPSSSVDRPTLKMGSLIEYVAYDNAFKELGTAIAKVTLYSEEDGAEIAELEHLGASDGYYAYYQKYEVPEDVLFHFCAKLGSKCRYKSKKEIIHIWKFRVLNKSDAKDILESFKRGYRVADWETTINEKGASKKDQAAAKGVLDDQLQALEDALEGGAGKFDDKRKEKLSSKLQELKEELTGSSGSGDRSFNTILHERAADVGNSAKKKKAKVAKRRKRKKKAKSSESDSGDTAYDSDADEDDFGDGGTKLEVKRLAIKRLAAKKKGALTKRGLLSMHEAISTLSGDGMPDEESILAPICTKYYLTVFLPNHPQLARSKKRAMRTLAQGMDLVIRGDTLCGLDMFMQRFKALAMEAVDGGDTISQHLELIPPDKLTIASAEEAEIAARIHAHEVRLGKLRA